MSTSPTTPQTPEQSDRLSLEERVELIRAMGWDPERVSPHHPVFGRPSILEHAQR